MAQQFHNGGKHGAPGAASVTVSVRDSRRYAIINPAGQGIHKRYRRNTLAKAKPIYWTEEQKRCFSFYNFIHRRFRRVM